MKKRDYFILAFLSCLVVYAALNRRSFAEANADKINDLLKQSNNSEVISNAKDSLISHSMDVRKGEF